MSTPVKFSEAEVQKLKNIYHRRARKGSSIQAIFADIKKYIKEELIPVTSNPHLKDRYQAYLRFNPAKGTLNSAFYGNGINRSKYADLEIMVSIYMQAFLHLADDTKMSPPGRITLKRFQPDIENKIAEFVSNFCCYQSCDRPMKAVSPEAPGKLIVLARACRIYGSDPDGRRFVGENNIDLDGVENGIWLCSVHADLVEEVGGEHITAEELMEWRRRRQLFVYELATGKKRITRFGFNLDKDAKKNAREIYHLLRAQIIVTHPGAEMLMRVDAIAMAEALKTRLAEYLDNPFWPLFLAKQVSGISAVCNALIIELNSLDEENAIKDTISVFRNCAVMVMKDIAGYYQLDVPGAN